MFIPSIDDARVDAEMRRDEQNGRSALRDACLDRDLLLAAITVVLFPSPGRLKAFCQDYQIDASIDEPSNRDLLRCALERIWDNRRRRYPAPQEVLEPQTLPVSDIPLGLADP